MKSFLQHRLKFLEFLKVTGGNIWHFRGIERFFHTDFKQLLAYEFLKNIALSMLGIFIPIMIYKATGTVFLPLVFLLALGTTSIVLTPFIMKLICRKGFYLGLGLSYLFLLPSIVLAIYLEFNLSSVILIGFLYSIGHCFHFGGLNLEFVSDTSSKERSMKAAELMSIPNLGRFLGPIIGGLLAATLGFHWVLLASLTVILISILPLLFIEEKKTGLEIDTCLFYDKDYSKYFPLFFLRGVQGITGVAIFSLFIYVVVGGPLSAGMVRSLDTLGFILTAYAAGLLASKYGRKRIIMVGSLLTAFFYLMRALVGAPLEAFIIALLGGISFKLFHVPLFSEFADQADRKSKSEFYTLKEIFTSFGEVVTGIVFLLLWSVFSAEISFRVIFIVAAICSVLLWVFDRGIEY